MRVLLRHQSLHRHQHPRFVRFPAEAFGSPPKYRLPVTAHSRPRPHHQSRHRPFLLHQLHPAEPLGVALPPARDVDALLLPVFFGFHSLFTGNLHRRQVLSVLVSENVTRSSSLAGRASHATSL
jgi:hypothetical protein